MCGAGDVTVVGVTSVGVVFRCEEQVVVMIYHTRAIPCAGTRLGHSCAQKNHTPRWCALTRICVKENSLINYKTNKRFVYCACVGVEWGVWM